MRVMHWNCQGLKRNPLTIPYLKDIRKSSKPDVLFLTETKNGIKYVKSIGTELGYAHSYVLPSEGLRGGLAIFWEDHISLSFMKKPSLHQTDICISEAGTPTFYITYIYGNPDQRLRNLHWKKLIRMAEAGIFINKPRVVLGDLNDIKSNEEKSGGPRRAEYTFNTFRRMLNTLGLHDLKTVGGQYTWMGHRKHYTIQSKIDRVVATAEWQDMFPRAYVKLLDWIGSDHKPLLLNTGDRKWKGTKLFRYDNRWRFNKEVKKEIQLTWETKCQSLPGSRFHIALKRCRSSLARWKSKSAANSAKKIEKLKNLLKQAYNSDPLDFAYINTIKTKLAKEYKLEEEYWRTKSRVLWLRVGDKNTRFFHLNTKQRRSFNRITAICDDTGKISTSEEEIQKIFINYFTDLYSLNTDRSTEEIMKHIKPKVTEEMNKDLTKPVSEEELFQALRQMDREKAPGPDGLNPGFFKDHWETIKTGALYFAKAFFDHENLEDEMNQTHICLIPKTDSPTSPKDFRPISLCNVAYKLISKVLADRLKPWLHLIISENQTAFIPNRLITDNILIAHELLHSLSTKRLKHPFLALKLDISKAFDKVKWNYIDDIMKGLGFNEKWCRWVMKCISSASYSILINGNPVGKIIPSRGIRQGDPISPYLYLLCTEGLSSIIQNSIQLGKLHGFKANRSGPAISHLLFADDSLLFCKAEEGECIELKQILQTYEEASGQAVNFNKSAIMFGKGLSREDKKNLSEYTGIHRTAGFGRYLGLPEFIGRNKCNAFDFITQKLERKISSLYTRFLSPAGKEVLLKAVATAIPAYSMSCFLLPKRVLNQMTKAMRKFWWSNAKDRQGIPWIAWSTIVDSKSLGGLGIRDLKDFNLALVAKQSWRILQNPNSLLSRVYKSKYFQKTGLLQAKIKSNASHAWKSILQGNELLKSGIRKIIGGGEQTYMWLDNWLPTNPPRPPKSLTNCIDLKSKVSEFLNAETL